MSDDAPRQLWTPPPDVRTTSRIGAYLAEVEAELGRSFASYEELWSWSVDDLEGFWESVRRHFDLWPDATGPVLASVEMPGARCQRHMY